jgi:hypothetical protein
MLDHAVVRIGILEPVIPAIANWKQLSPIFKDINKARSLIKNIFCRLRQFRTIATCYHRTAQNFFAAIKLATAVT